MRTMNQMRRVHDSIAQISTCAKSSLVRFFFRMETDSTIKWDLLNFRPSPWFILFPLPTQPPISRAGRREYLEDHLILLDFVGYYLCKLIVHHCLLWRGDGSEGILCSMSSCTRKSERRIEEKISRMMERLSWRVELVKYKNINNFPFIRFHRRDQQQFLAIDGFRRRKSERNTLDYLNLTGDIPRFCRILVNILTNIFRLV